MKILESLAVISTNYKVFKKDQVLTHCQLNSLSNYLDDQSRLTRANLLGVGVACGLRVSVQDGSTATVTVTSGVGVTTDGDLLYFNNDTVFDKFKPYDESNPQYEPFFANDTMIPVYELVQKDKPDTRADPLNLFEVNTGKPLKNMVALLLMESYVKDNNLCAGSGCDNLGGDCVNTLKLLLVDKTSVGWLQHPVATDHQAFGGLREVEIDRPVIQITPSPPNTFSQLAGIYRTACTALLAKLLDQLPKLYPLLHCSPFFADAFPSDPSATWKARLNAIDSKFVDNRNSSQYYESQYYGIQYYGIQYYYDFLKDVADTYNDLRDLLFGDYTWCCPNLYAFPKHLLLGNLVPGANPDDNRTPFYPSPLLSQTMEQSGHASFLVRKLDTLIQTFQVPDSAVEIRITPSMAEEHPLEERAIPYYYQVNETYPIHKNWSYRLHQRGMDINNYSYNAAACGAKGAAANPFYSQISRFSFFRIEGHLGKKISDALAIIEAEIKNKNLPFAVRSIMLGADRTKLIKPDIRYSDMHRFHYLLRQDIIRQLDEVNQFNSFFKKLIPVGEDIGLPANTTVSFPDSFMISDVRSKFEGSYLNYKPSWQPDLKTIMKTAGNVKSVLGEEVRTEFSTPFDSLISNTHTQWLSWLDGIIRIKGEKEDDKLFFDKFISQHPGMEHFAGVSRGGTFVLVYDDSKTVVADFMLPYHCCETTEDLPEEETLPPDVRPSWGENDLQGIKVIPSRTKFVDDKLAYFQDDLLVNILPNDILPQFKKEHVDVLNTSINRINETLSGQQTQYFQTMNNSMTSMNTAFTSMSNIFGGMQGGYYQYGVGGTAAAGAFSNKELDQKINSTRAIQQVVDYYNEKARQPDLTDDVKQKYLTQVQEAEKDLANAITSTVNYLDSSKVDVSMGSEGFTAMMELNTGLGKITTAQTAGEVKTNLSGLQNATTNMGLKLVLGGMLGTINKT